MTARRRRLERLLLLAVYAGIALALLTPLISAPWTLYPFSIGKALYARILIAVVFALWTVLAAFWPQWRPPRSALLAALAASLVASVVSAWFGVSPERSFWSTYTRMQGIVNTAHWVAFAIVVASVVRTGTDWTRLLNANLAVGLCVAVMAVVRYFAPETPLPVPRIEGYWPRVGASAGNPILLGAYLQAIALLAIGFLVRSCCDSPAPPATRQERRRLRKGSTPRTVRDGYGLRLFWAATAAFALAGVSLTGSLGAFLGVSAGFGAVAALYALFGRTGRSRLMGLTGLGALGVFAVVLGTAAALRTGGEESKTSADNPLLERVTSVETIGVTLGKRLRIWEAGIAAFADRPLLGWGPENYFVAAARYISVPTEQTRVQYHAHNVPLEEAVGKGLAGVATWLALWSLTALVVVRAARRLEDARERALAVFVGAALVGWFTQGLTAFYSAESWLQHMLLLGFLARLEVGMRGDTGSTNRLLSWVRARPIGRTMEGASRIPAARLRVGLRVAAGTAAIALAGASLGASVAIHTGAFAMWRADHGGPFIAELERGIDAFEPLAAGPRVVLFNNLALNWHTLERGSHGEASRLLALAEAEAPAALAAQPESWVLHHALARLYVKVSSTRPEYAGRAERHLERSRALAPNLDPMEAPRPPPRVRR